MVAASTDAATAAAPWIIAGASVLVALIGGRSQWKVARDTPSTLSDGWSKLVADLRVEQTRMEAEVARLRAEMAACHAERAVDRQRIVTLEARLADLAVALERPPSARTRVDD